MVMDVVPVLNEKIQTSFKGNVMKDRRVARVSKRIRDGTANLADAHDYAASLGENLSKALLDNLTEQTLPNGTLYYNIAERTIVPALENNYNLINETAEQIQKIVDKKQKIGLKSVKAEFPKERIQGLIDKMTTDNKAIDEALAWLKEPIVNNSESFMDDFVESNAKFRTETGLKAKLVRKAEAKCCDWCAALEGEYDYGSAPDDIYRRHEFCRCTVTYKTEKTSQGVWSKRIWKTSPEDLEVRKAAGSEKQEMTRAERIEQANRLYMDKLVAGTKNTETSLERTYALRKARKMTPEERLAKLKEYEEKRKG